MWDLSDPSDEKANGFVRLIAFLLFSILFFYFWITLSPFVDLTTDSALDPSAGNSYRLNQILALATSLGLLAFGFFHPLRSELIRPRFLFVMIACWFLFVSLLSDYPMLGIKGVTLSCLMMVNANIFLLLPKSDRQFAIWLGLGTLGYVLLSYLGILFLPSLSIHQVAELREPMNAGLWRGHFPHKNSAAAAMVIACYVGLFVMQTWSRLVGLVLIVLSVWFLIKTGGKTSMAMLPSILVLAWLFEWFAILRIPIVFGGVGLFNFLAIGSAVIEPLGAFLSKQGLDATFTNRTDIWRFAVDAVVEKPFLGHGFKAFWQTQELVYSGGTIETWAAAAYNGHNSYLDILLTTGAIGLFLTILLILVLPVINFFRIDKEEQHSALTKLYLRIWLFTIFLAGLESMFFEGANSLWFTCMLSLFGLQFQARTQIVRPQVL